MDALDRTHMLVDDDYDDDQDITTEQNQVSTASRRPASATTHASQFSTFLSYKKLASGYLGDSYDPQEVYEKVGGKVLQNRNSNPDAFQNSCAIRMCAAFNSAGAYIKPSQDDKAKSQAGTGADKRWYYYRVSAFSNYLKRTYGPPTNTYTVTSKMTAEDIQAKLAGRTGIIQFTISGWKDASGHFTFYDGSKPLHGNYFDPDELKNAKLVSVNFWAIK